MMPALEISNLTISFPSETGPTAVVRQVSLHVHDGEIVSLVGESGSGKSITAMCAMGLQPASACVIADRIRVAGHDVPNKAETELQRIRGAKIALVPQEPMNALNPTVRIGRQLEMVVRSHRSISRDEAHDVAGDYLERMLITDVSRIMQAYPFELSGGMRQRVLLAMAFSCQPEILIADEPTTALDVTVQDEVLTLVRECAAATSTAVLFITHDLAVVWNLSQRIYVMEQGIIVETGDTKDVITNPKHAYTRRLLASLPGMCERRSMLSVADATTPHETPRMLE